MMLVPNVLSLTLIISLSIDHSSLTVYVDKLKRVYQTPPTTWLPLPNCKHVKLAMINEKGTRHTRESDELIEHRVKGEIEPLMASKVPVDMDNIFEQRIFENACRPLVILVEGAFGSGKSTLAYHYCQKWAQGNLAMFDLVALVYLRHPAVHLTGKGLTLHQLLLLASDGEESVDDEIVRHMTQLVKDGLKFLLILDGWDEAPACIRAPPDLNRPPDNSFLGKLLRSVPSNTTILITSRPDSSVSLHKRSNVKRMEILGFTKKSIHEYFREALSTQLSPQTLGNDCRKLKEHLANYPAIESSCYIPLNAAILTLLYLQRDRTLPTTHFEMFHELLLCGIACEVNTRQLNHQLGAISSLDALPRNLKKQLKRISTLAYEGVMNNKTAIPTPAQQDLPAMGVLQKVQWAGTSNEAISYNFAHLSIQEMLAAYRISQMGNDEQVRVFRTLLDNPRFAAVLQFYAGFTKLTNRGVRNIITSSGFYTISTPRLVNFLRCFFEAQIKDRTLYSKFSLRLNGRLTLNHFTLSPLDCMSIGYFLAFALEAGAELHVNLSHCGIDDHSFGLIMKELSRHVDTSAKDALHGVIELNISGNKISDNSMDHIAAALRTNTTIRTLDISRCSSISILGCESLASALAVNRSLEELSISYNKFHNGINYIAAALRTNTTLNTLRISCSNSDITHIASALRINNALKRLVIEEGGVSDAG